MATSSFGPLLVLLFLPHRSELQTMTPTAAASSNPSVGEPIGNTSEGNSNWLLILLIVMLFVCAIALTVQIALFFWQRSTKRKAERIDSERQLLLHDQDLNIETVKSQQQPTAEELPIQLGTSLSRPVKQQIPAENIPELTETSSTLDNVIPKGLVNLGNTCFFNSVLQCLNQTHLLGEKLYAHADAGELTIAFKEFLNLMHHDMGHSFPPSNVFQVFCRAAGKYADGGQHDSHECLRDFLDQLRREERKSWELDEQLKQNSTLVDKVFGGHFVTVYTCMECGIPYHLCEPFLDISLPIILNGSQLDYELENPEKESLDRNLANLLQEVEANSSEDDYKQAAKAVVTPLNSDRKSRQKIQKNANTPPSIEDCLRYFTRQEFMIQEYLCKTCGEKNKGRSVTLTSATKHTVILNPPAILTLHLKRFDLKSHGFVKCDNKVFFDELLDISPFCSSLCTRNEAQDRNLWYSLYGVIVHAGSLKSGHNVAFVKIRNGNRTMDEPFQPIHIDRELTVPQLIELMHLQREKDKDGTKATWEPGVQRGTWYVMNDSHVQRVSQSSVLDQNAYLLFYERLDSSLHKAT